MHKNRTYLELRFFGQAGLAAGHSNPALQLFEAVYILIQYDFKGLVSFFYINTKEFISNSLRDN